MRRCARRLRSREFFLHGVVYRSNYVVYVVFFFFSCSVVYWSIFFSCGVMCLSIFFFFSFFSCSVVCWSNTVIVFVDVYFGDVRFGHVDLSLARILFLFLFTWRCVYLE